MKSHLALLLFIWINPVNAECILFGSQNKGRSLQTTDSVDLKPRFQARNSRVHFYAGYSFWHGKRFKQDELTFDPGVLDEPEHVITPNNNWGGCFGGAITLPGIKLGGFPLSIGFGVEKVQNKFGGYLDVEKVTYSWLGEKIHGDYLDFMTDIESYALSASINLKPYKPRHFFGYSAYVFSSIRYFDIEETEEVIMQGDYHVNGTTGQLDYQTERFQRTFPADKIAVEVGGRLELHASRFISLILPQITLRGTIFRKKVPGCVYESKVDGDILEMPDRRSGYYGLFLMAGVAFHL